jgi:hypothetical protein
MPAIDRAEAKRYLSNFDFTGFFSELLGWNRPPRSVPLVKQIGIQSFAFSLIAEKKGYAVLLCESIPSYQDRAKLDRLIARDYFEHMLIFLDRSSKKQLWQVSLREKGRGVRLREVHLSVSGEELLQKLEHIIVPLEKEETTHLTDIHAGVKTAFDVEKVTKRFFKQFELEHESFAKFLKGIPATTKPWYVSVLINRLMFLYFMQAKRFLNDDPHYLTTKLSESTARAKDTFYRDFLCPLFFQGFALRESERTASVKKLLGDIPYLNGGLFQRHPLEIEHGDSITIPDSAFEKLFTFFGKWTWHLDQRTSADGDEIDPDVLGYIFEKYINQKQMGAYYTKEDITGYIAQNTILPFLFDAARKDCANAFKADGVVWRLLIERPDRYIYEAMRRGNESTANVQRLALPPDLAAGLEDVVKRSGWNRAMPDQLEEFALPSETWREFIVRRRRYDELRSRIETGEVHKVNDLISLNLDIRQLALDVIQYAGSEDLVESLYKAIEKVTILDPTCGSGAFLFAALELLQPLYEACLERMEGFVGEAEAEAATAGVKLHFNRFAHFRKTLAAAATHVNHQYFILKTIIVNNLYGVDIMEEATEICKLRLFLKLVSQIDPKHKDRIEPLPDIDFNIRAGNTLIGYALYDDVRKASESTFAFGDNAMERIDDKLKTLDLSVTQFRKQQTDLGGSVTAKDKAQLEKQYKELEAELDDFLATEYAIKKIGLVKWKQDTKPFHWFCDFHAIIESGGFNVIIGNPPYVTFPSTKVPYAFSEGSFQTIDTKNLYALTFERSTQLLSATGYCGLIVQLTSISSGRMAALQNVVGRDRNILALPFPRRPESMFDGVEMPVAILQIGPGTRHGYTTSRVNRFYTEERPVAIQRLEMHRHSIRVHGHRIAKLGSSIEESILCKLLAFLPHNLGVFVQSGTEHLVYYQEACRYWAKACLGIPRFLKNGTSMQPSHGRVLQFDSAGAAGLATCILNSSLFYWYYSALSDCEHINDDLVRSFPMPAHIPKELWAGLADSLSASIASSSIAKKITTKQGHTIEYDEISASKHKIEIDQIDRVLAKHYGLTDEEADFIVNYDIKYRMGTDSGDAEVDD